MTLLSMQALDRQHVQGGWAWRAYDRWNAAIADEFFAGSYGGKPVYLDLEDDVLERVAERAGEEGGAPRDALVAAVVPTLFLRNPGILFKAHLSRLDAWDLLGPPPCVAVLGLLSLAAESMASDGELRETNYYGRLMQLIGLDPTDRAIRNQVARALREQSHPLWDRLARWMSGRPSVRGLPTAQPLGRLTHVGLPISQALIRAADRDALHELFADRGLQPGQEVSTRDMATLLRDWLPQGRASTGLRRLCASDDSLDKVAEVACHELRSWRGAFEEAAARGRASVQARISKHPRRRLRLSLLLTSLPPDATTAVLRTASGGTPHSGVVQADADVQLGGEVEAGVRELAIEVGGLGSLLSGPLSVRAGNAVATRSPRPLVVLVYDELANAYREAPRARLAVPLLILAPVALAGAVEAAISGAARPDFVRRRAEDLEGIPGGWDLFEQVLLLGRPRDLSSDLDQLVPSGSTQLSIVGGVRLPPGRAWLASRAPEICVSNEDGAELRLTLSAENALTGEREEVGDWMISETPLLSLTDLDLPSGRYEARVTAASDDRAIHHHTFSLVTPESATPVEEWLAHDLSQPWGAVAAEPVVGVTRPLRGADLESVGHYVAPPTLECASKPTRPEAEEATEAGCPEHGQHHFVRQTARLISGGSSVWVCSRCGAVRAEMPRRSPVVAAKGAVAPPLSGDAVSPEQTLDLDALLEAASALGSGRHETLLGLIDRLDEIAGDGRRLIELLSALGHIDVARDSRWLRAQRWSIAPTTIVVGAFGAFLTGWRSEGLIHRLGRLAHDLGGRVRSVAQPLAPSRVAIEGLDSEGLELVALEASGSPERDIAVVLHPGPRLASRLPTLREIRQTLTSVEPRWTSRTESMDPRTGRWRPGGKPQALGSFRRDTPAGRFYWHFDGVDGRQVDWTLARWLGVGEGPPLISWDAHEESLACHLSCPLPPLFERAAVLCSGIPPSRRDGSLVYSGVDRDTAYTLIQRLTSDRTKDAVGIL